MTWPEYIAKQFSVVDPFTRDESDFYGPYNTLLNALFPTTGHYQVTPHFKRLPSNLDYTILYVVSKLQTPIFLLTIKTASSVDHLYSRAQADEQIRSRFVEFSSADFKGIPKLFGVCAMGPRFAIYEYTPDDRRLVPARIDPDLNSITDTAPASRWKHDLRESEGEAKLKEIADEIKAMAGVLD